MKHIAKRIFYSLFIMIGLWLFSFNSSYWFQSSAKAKSIKNDVSIQEISSYRKWMRANQQTVQMEAAVAALCAPAAPVKLNPGVKPNPSPHKDKFINVYVNAIGQHALTLERSPKYPQGSIIVKEKLSSATGTTPELLTVMIKRERGYNPSSNDWEFLVVSGDMKTIIERGKLENCTACHASQRGSDFVFRNYLTPSDWQRMK